MTFDLGATPDAHGTSFTVWAPHSTSVAVRLHDAHGAPSDDAPLARGDGDLFRAHLPGVAAGVDYFYVLDDGRALPDPASRSQPHGVHGPSRVVDPSTFAWTDGAWRGLPAIADYVIYELHVGTFSDRGTFDGAIEHLKELKALGVTAIELMPIAEFPGDRNWGYDGVHLYAAQSSYGGPDALRRLVDAAHATGLAVLLDVVYNHLGPEGNYLDAYGPYFTDRYCTPWGRAVNCDGAGSERVRRHLVENALYWVADCHVDALRVDAVHAIYDASPRHLLADLTDAVHARGESLGRAVHLIAESDLNDARTVTPTAAGGLGFDAQWADDLHHALHVALTGETRGYYAAFAPAPVVDALRTPFVRQGRGFEPSRPALAPPNAHVAEPPRDRFVVAVQNHDQVGNRATGERIGALVHFEQRKLAAALVLLSGYVPLLFMGEEYGEANPFLYFVSHGDSALLAAVRDGRRAEFADFAWDDAVPDPGDPATFARSRLDRRAAATPQGTALRTLYADLLALRAAEPALRPGAAAVHTSADADGRAGTVVHAPHDAAATSVCVAFNLADEPRDVVLPRSAGGAPLRWHAVLSTRAAAYAEVPNASEAAARVDGPEPRAVRLPAHAAEVFVARA